MVSGIHISMDVQLAPVFPFDDWTMETNDPNMDYIAQKLIDICPRMLSVLGGGSLNTAIRSPVAYARAGRGSQMPNVLSKYYNAFSPMVNGRSTFEGVSAESIEHLGMLTTTLQESLLQSVPTRPGEDEIISVCSS